MELSPDHWYTQHVNELNEKADREQMALVHPPEDNTDGMRPPEDGM